MSFEINVVTKEAVHRRSWPGDEDISTPLHDSNLVITLAVANSMTVKPSNILS